MQSFESAPLPSSSGRANAGHPAPGRRAHGDPTPGDPAPGRPAAGGRKARRGRAGWVLRLAGAGVAASAAAAIHAGCCHRPPCGPPPAEPCPTVSDGGTPDGPPPGACPSVAQIAEGQAIPPVGTCGVGVWICALAADLPAVIGQATFVTDEYEVQWGTRVRRGWLGLTAHLQAAAADQPAVSRAAWALGDTLTTFTADAASRKRLAEGGYWQQDAQDLYDAAKAIPGLELPCERP